MPRGSFRLTARPWRGRRLLALALAAALAGAVSPGPLPAPPVARAEPAAGPVEQPQTLQVACNTATLVGDVSNLISAIQFANASTGPTTISLGAGCTYTLTAINSNDGTNGPNGLPIITSNLIIQGNAGTITRSPSGAAFRFFQIGAGASLTLNSITLSGGATPGGAAGGAGANGGSCVTCSVSNGGNGGNGGNAPNGGAVLNFGSLAIADSALTSNATGAGGTGGAGGAGSSTVAETPGSGGGGGAGGNSGNGGAIYSTGVMTISTTVISQNSTGAGGAGGAGGSYGTADIGSNGNAGPGGPGGSAGIGGAILNAGTATIVNGPMQGNATGNGGNGGSGGPAYYGNDVRGFGGTGGSGGDGGAIFNAGQLSIIALNESGSTTGSGGAGGSGTGAAASGTGGGPGSGGAIYNAGQGALGLANSSLTGNALGTGAFAGAGGGLLNQGYALLVGDSIVNNTPDNVANTGGGAATTVGSPPGTITYVNPAGNDANTCTSVTQPCLTIGAAARKAGNNGAVTIAAGTYTETLTISQTVGLFGLGSATRLRGSGQAPVVAITSSGNATLLGVTVERGGSGAASIGNAGSLLLALSSVSDNDGGGILNTGTLSAALSTIGGNRTRGGLQTNGTAALTQTTISGNSVAAGVAGGGIYNNGTLTITQSTIDNNQACYGSGIANDPNGTLTLTNVTVSGNVGTQGGGGINNLGTMTLNNDTIANNTPPNVDDSLGIIGIDAQGCGTPGSLGPAEAPDAAGGPRTPIGARQTPTGTITVRNTIIARSQPGANCGAPLTSRGYNLSSDGSCTLAGPGDLQHLDPRLGPLTDNGGRTRTHALLTGSPAINAGHPANPGSGGDACAPVDQRGLLRPQFGGRCDIGAFELAAQQSGTPTPVVPELPPLWLFASGLLALGGLTARTRGRRSPRWRDSR